MTRNFPDALPFGTEVLVSAETMRVVAANDPEGTHRYTQLLRSMGYAARGGIAGAVFHQEGWPGAPVGEDWNPGPRGYPLEPAPNAEGDRPIRLRRMLAADPPRGVVVGVTDRSEGVLVGRQLHRPGRLIVVLEVALALRSGRAKIILAHPRDVQPVPRLRSRP